VLRYHQLVGWLVLYDTHHTRLSDFHVDIDVAGAVACTTITLNGFTVPAGQGLTLKLASGTKVTMGKSTGSPFTCN
jgi:hypothetical protein